MNINLLYKEIMSEVGPVLVLSGSLALTIALIVMLINMIINAATGKGLHIGVR